MIVRGIDKILLDHLKGKVLRSDTFLVTRLVRSLEEDWGGGTSKEKFSFFHSPKEMILGIYFY